MNVTTGAVFPLVMHDLQEAYEMITNRFEAPHHPKGKRQDLAPDSLTLGCSRRSREGKG